MDFSFMSYPFSFILWFSFCYPLFNLLENHFCFLFRLSVKFLSSLNLILNTIGEVHNDNANNNLSKEKKEEKERKMKEKNHYYLTDTTGVYPLQLKIEHEIHSEDNDHPTVGTEREGD